MSLRALSASLVLLLVVPAVADVPDPEWRSARKLAMRVMKLPGLLSEKEKALGVLEQDDSVRSAEVLVRWTAASLTLEKNVIRPEFDKTRERLDKLEGQLKKAYVEPYTDVNDNGRHDEGEPFKDKNSNKTRDGWPPRTMNREHRASWNTLKKAHGKHVSEVQTEDLVRGRIAAAVGRFRNSLASKWLATEGLDALEKAKAPGRVALGVVRCVIGQEADWKVPVLLRLGGPDAHPKARILILNWAGEARSPGMFDLVVGALRDKHVTVRRVAVAALKAYDDPKAVKPLIDALAKAKGLPAEEIEAVLHWYTGRAFEGVAKVWKKWFKNEGQAWLEKGDKTRHAPQKVTHAGTTTATTFYDIPTESKRIVFVLDRSGSMKTPAGHTSKKKKKEKKKPRAPVTGDKPGGKKDGDGDDDEPIAGDTKLEVAKNKLKMTISRLKSDIKFGVVFYSSDVTTWKNPPGMELATKANKDAAIKWFKGLGPDGSTSLFPALMKALGYADSFGSATNKKKRKKATSGANTIFLLSDGSPTVPGGGKALPASEVDKQLNAFLEANKMYRCIVHTIGVGPSHNRTLMGRIAKATGGTYVAVGVD